MKDPLKAIHYCREILEGRWPEAEPIIATNAEAAYKYAMGILGGRRFLLGEPAILADPKYADRYRYRVLSHA